MQFTGIYEDNEGNTGVVCFIDIAADNPQEAMERFNKEYNYYQIKECKYRHGGYRPGSGRKRQYKEQTTSKKVPESLAKDLDKFLLDVSALCEIVDQYEGMADASPTSVRYERLRQFIHDSKQYKADIKELLDKIY